MASWPATIRLLKITVAACPVNGSERDRTSLLSPLTQSLGGK